MQNWFVSVKTAYCIDTIIILLVSFFLKNTKDCRAILIYLNVM